MLQTGQHKPWQLKTWLLWILELTGELEGNVGNYSERGGRGECQPPDFHYSDCFLLGTEAGDQPALKPVQTEYKWGRVHGRLGPPRFHGRVMENAELKRGARRSWLFHWTTDELNLGYGALHWHSAVLGTVGGIYEVAQQGQALGEGCFESAWTSCEPAVGFPLRPREPGRHEQQLLQQREPRVHGSERHGRHVEHVQHEWWLGNVTHRWLLVTSFFKKQKNKKLSLTVLQYKLVIYALL